MGTSSVSWVIGIDGPGSFSSPVVENEHFGLYLMSKICLEKSVVLLRS